ncbi:hypothetical protein BCD67_06540 [Oscillatoriales cyanobacterium USR001]|nr:hypothetical protein BCD67_06540 [Oscillatoriales cyanobacterium USR001]
MSQRSSVKSPNQIKPVLQAVLGCLDVNLEAEMNQYRRQRQRSQQWVAPSSVSQSPRQSIDLISPEGNDRPQAGSLPPSLEAKTRPTIDFETRSPDAQLAISSQTLESKTTSANGDRSSTHPGNNQKSPNNYLESSEELLRSLEEEKSQPKTERNLVSSLFTPLGLISMLLFLLSCTALSYTTINPSIWANLGFNPWGKQNPKPATSPTNKVANSNQGELPKAPNLASKEFFELDLSTLSNVKPTPSPIPVPSIKPSVPPLPQGITGVSLPSLKTQQSPNVGGTNNEGLDNLQKALLPKIPPSPVAPKPLAPIPSAVKPGNPKPDTGAAATPKPSPVSPGIPIKAQDGYYYVVLDYSNEQSLAQAQTVVPDAYVREFPNGVKIQMGALADAKSAEQLVKELQEKGITAKYYQP